jgi:light-regulated signal transduction histidine kinase (bacteriophytochrome)
VASSLRETAPERQVQFDIAPGLEACADRTLTRVLLDNLLGNAFKYTAGRERAQIGLSVTEQNAERVYCVADNGVGFDMQYAGRLFGAFQRLHAPNRFEGLGIGLATVQRIVHRHGGRVWAEASPEQGARFCFTLGGESCIDLGGDSPRLN